MSKEIQLLKKLAGEAELEVIETPHGHVLVIGGVVNVTWWPESRRKTVYAEGAPRGHRFATPKIVIAIATGEME